MGELERRYESLEDCEYEGLNSFWNEITDYLQETDLDWIRKDDIKEGQDIDNIGFSQAYDAFLELFEPPMSTGEAFAFYEMDYEDIVEAGEELDIGKIEWTTEENFTNPIDEGLEGERASE